MPLDQRIRSLLDDRTDPGDLASLPVETLRARAREAITRWKSLGVIDRPVASIENVDLQRPDGVISLRIYRPVRTASGKPTPIIVYLHGGGWVVCDLDTHDGICRAICDAADAVVVAVGYRRAPEHPLPGPIDDAIAATRWAVEHLDPVQGTPIFLAGDSAGANIAAVAALRLRDDPTIALAGQILIYPVTDSPQTGHASMEAFKTGDAYGQNHALYCRYVDLYLAGQDSFSPDFAPLRSPSLDAAPPALVITAEFDMLRDEGEAYARRLSQSGIDIRLDRVAGVNHGYLHLIGYLPAANATIGLIGQWVRERQVAWQNRAPSAASVL